VICSRLPVLVKVQRSAFENRLRAGLAGLVLINHANKIQPLSRIKTLNGPGVGRISPVGKEKVYRGNERLVI